MHAVISTISSFTKIGIAGDLSNQSMEDDKAADKIYSKRLTLGMDQKKSHELAINKQFLSFLGIHGHGENLWPEFWTDERDLEWAREFVPREKGTVTLAVCPGVTSLPEKFYPGAKYSQALAGLKNIAFSVILFGAPGEEDMCDDVAKALTASKNVKTIINLAGESTIRQMIEGLRRCDAVISQETGALHVGVALGRPTVGILGGGHFGRFYPWGDEKINRVANREMCCYWCNWLCSYPTIKCIEDISPGIVAEQLRSALAGANLFHSN
jgi:ADP-heptose:LPS heptosyltransferase